MRFKGILGHIWRKWRARRRGHRHGKINQYAPELVIAIHLGKEPVWDPINNPEHHQIQIDQIPTDTDAWKTELNKTERELHHHVAAWVWRLLFAALAFGEFEGALLFFRDLGCVGLQRIALAAMLAIFLFILVYFAARLVTEKDAKGRPVRRRAANWVIGAFALVAIALAVFRVSTVPPAENGSRASEIAIAIIMVGATIGPAIAVEHVFRQLAPVARLTKLSKQLRKKITKQEAIQERAKAEDRRFGRYVIAWQNEAEMLTGQYQDAYILAGGKYFPANLPDKNHDLHLVHKDGRS